MNITSCLLPALYLLSPLMSAVLLSALYSLLATFCCADDELCSKVRTRGLSKITDKFNKLTEKGVPEGVEKMAEVRDACHRFSALPSALCCRLSALCFLLSVLRFLLSALCSLVYTSLSDFFSQVNIE
jgi:uncharacterized membrane protein (DUF106 family)